MAGWRIVLWAVVVLAALGFLYLVRGILLPFILAIILAVVLDPTVRKLRMRGLSRGLAVGAVLLGFFAVLTVLAVIFTPMASAQLGTFRTTVERLTGAIAAPDPNQNYFVRWNPVIVAEVPERQDILDRTLRDVEPVLKTFGLPATRKGLYDRYIAPNSKQIAGAVQNFFNAFFGLLGAFTSQLFLLIFTPIILVMLLLDLEKIKKRAVIWIPPSIRSSTVDLLNDIGSVFTSYLRGITLIVLIYMAIATFVLFLLNVPYSFLLGMLLGLIYLIPYIRILIWAPLLAGICWFSGNSNIWFIQLPSPLTYAIVVVAVYLAFDTGFDTFLTPRIIGKSVGLNAVVSVFVSLAGGAAFGITGMLLAYPVAGAVKVVLDRILKFTSASPDNLSLPAVPIRHRA